MKKLISIAVFGISALGIAPSAFAFPIEGTAFVTPGLVTVQFCNPAFAPLQCEVSATGMLNTGVPLFATETLILPPGECEYAYVYATYPFFFMNGSGYGQCF